MHVVPDEVGVERRDDRGERSGRARQHMRADRVHEKRRRGRNQDLGEADRPPLAAEDPVDRNEEEAVQRLRVRRGLARDEPERAVMDERLREVVALVGERGEDGGALVQQDHEPRCDRRDGDQPEVRPPHATTKIDASTCSRTQSSSINRHQSR